VRRRPGECDQAAIDRTTEAWIELRDGIPWVVPNDNFEESAPDDEFILAVAAQVRSIDPGLEVVDENRDDGHLRWLALAGQAGAVDITVYRGQVQLQQGDSWSEATGYQSMWTVVLAVGETFDFVVHDPDWGDVFDLGLDADEFAGAYSL